MSVLALIAHIIAVWSRTRGAIHMPRTHHQATRGDITTRSAAVPHSAKHAPPLERLCLCVVLWPSGVWLCFLIRFFARALTRRGKRRARGRVCVCVCGPTHHHTTPTHQRPRGHSPHTPASQHQTATAIYKNLRPHTTTTPTRHHHAHSPRRRCPLTTTPTHHDTHSPTHHPLTTHSPTHAPRW